MVVCPGVKRAGVYLGRETSDSKVESQMLNIRDSMA